MPTIWFSFRNFIYRWKHGNFYGIFRPDTSSSAHIDNENKDILILGEGPSQELDDTTLTVEAMYPIYFTQPNQCAL